ncbi:MAG: rhomboid family intramembrane serine protease [Candidatus Eremiobacteraeota bacterium]|nr:rhomboid family intramembrane serine protease [Candidatus Eremiobacteraeota bacterium]
MIPLRDPSRRGAFALATYALVAANVYMFVLELRAPNVARFIDAFAVIPYNLTHGITLPPPSPHPVFLTLFTAMFLHASFLHIFFNMLFLLVFGPALEGSFGTIRFLIFYFACGLVGGIAQIVVAPFSQIPEIGASGAIAGVLGGYILRYPANMIEAVLPIGCLPLFLRVPAVLLIGLWAAVQFIHGFGAVAPGSGAERGGVAYFAHIGGFICGIILTVVLHRRATEIRAR